ncbi:MAG TPA: PilZ domain-containing protein [Candidatus Sulfotelmatobacter sp.]|nr:PilZ domain-containing protein [Candidatus Sulfotelmatobacter sp.]
MRTEPLLFSNRRLHKRYQVSGTAKVLHGMTALDLPIRDISLSGIGLDCPGTAPLSVGNLCLVGLPANGKLDAMVVGVRSQSLHLQFMQTDSEEVRAFIEANAGSL